MLVLWSEGFKLGGVAGLVGVVGVVAGDSPAKFSNSKAAGESPATTSYQLL